MPRGELRTDEEAAGKIVAQQLGGTAVPRDVPGAANATHDFDIELSDGRRIPLEVTSATDEAIEALCRVALEKVWEAPSLVHHWWIGLPRDGTLRIKPLMAEVIPYLEVLERHHIEEVGGALVKRLPPADAGEEVAAAARGVLELGITHANRLGHPKPGEAARVVASLHGGVGSDFDSMNDLVAKRAREKVEKLRAAPGDERHLFVWIRSSDAELALATLPPPPSTPVLPDGIDVVWVANAGGNPDAPFDRLLCLRPPGGWETIR